MKTNTNTKTNTSTRNDINTVNMSGTVSHVKAYNKNAGGSLVKGLIKSEKDGHFVSVPFTIWDANKGIPEDGDVLAIAGELSCSSYEKDGVKKYSTFVSVNNYEAQ